MGRALPAVLLSASPETHVRAFGIMDGKQAGESSAQQGMAQTRGPTERRKLEGQETSRVSERGLETLLLIDWKLDQMHFLPSAC